MSFNPQDYVSPYVTIEEVLEIKKAFDLFDRDLGGAIDPRGTSFMTQSSRLQSILWELRPRPRQSIRWLLNSIKTAADRLSSLSSSTWWPPDLLIMRPETRSTRFSSLSTHKKQVCLAPSRFRCSERLEKGCQGPGRTYWWQHTPGDDRESWYRWRWCCFWGRVLCFNHQEGSLIYSHYLAI